MLAILSPSKTMDFDNTDYESHSKAEFQSEAWTLIKKLKRMTKAEIKELMSISDNLTRLNYERFKEFSEDYVLNKNAKQAILAYQGDVYTGFDAGSLNASQLDRAQEKLRIISGLYGILRPLDLIQAYRLEMSRPLSIMRHNNLYDFWGESLTDSLNHSLKQSKTHLLVNLASNEYYKAIHPNKLDGEILEITFREKRGDELKFISFNAKKARGLMARFIVIENIYEKEHLKAFDYEGYLFSEQHSDSNNYFFIKE